VPDRARQPAIARDRVVPVGLSATELALLRTAATGHFDLVVPHTVSPLALDDTARHDVVCVVAWDWWRAVRTAPELAQALARRRIVLLVPPDPAPEPRLQLARELPRAQPVFTAGPDAAHALRHALRAVCHQTVADALRARLARAGPKPDCATRALDEALQLRPHERTVPALARALYRSERTLRRHLQAIHPSFTPQQVLRWAQLLHAAWYLSASADPFARVAQRVGASDAANLRRALRDATGFTFRALVARHGDPVDLLLAMWRSGATCRPADLPTRRPADPPTRRPADPPADA
jgi:AraC-like DNA-binding protein